MLATRMVLANAPLVMSVKFVVIRNGWIDFTCPHCNEAQMALITAVERGFIQACGHCNHFIDKRVWAVLGMMLPLRDKAHRDLCTLL